MAAVTGRNIQRETYGGDPLEQQEGREIRSQETPGPKFELEIGKKPASIELKPNPKAAKSLREKTMTYLDTAQGKFRAFQAAGKSCTVWVKTLDYLGKVPSASLLAFEKLFNKAWQVTAVLEMFPMVDEAIKALSNFQAKVDLKALRNPEQLDLVFGSAQKVCDGIAMTGYGTSLLADCAGKGELSELLKMAADHVDAGANTSAAAKFLNERAALLKGAEQAREKELYGLEKTLIESAKGKTVRIAKAIFSIAGLVFGYLVAAKVFALAPVIAAVISLGSTLLAIAAHFYEESRGNEVCSLKDFKFPVAEMV